jgi:hypothetical protein
MGQVERRKRRLPAHLVEHLVKGLRAEIPVILQRRRRREQAQPLIAAHQKPVEQRIVQTAGLGQRFGDGLGGS